MVETKIGRQGNLVVNRLLKSDGTPDGFLAWFWCPGCEDSHAYRFGGGKEPQWVPSGSVEAPSFTPSLLLTTGSKTCHLFLTNGELAFCGDCTHGLAGSTVPLPEPPSWLLDF